MSFHVKIQGGDEDGKSFAVETPCVVGRAPSCQVRLTNPKISWEHLSLRDTDGRLFLQNLSAAAVKVAGKTIRGEQRLVHGEVIELPDGVALLVEERVGGGSAKGLQINVPFALTVVVLVVAGFFVAFEALKPPARGNRFATATHWHTAQVLLDERLEKWVEQGDFPAEAAVLFRDAWRMGLASNPLAALDKWSRLRAALLTLNVPGKENAELGTIVQAAGLDDLPLRVIMGFEPDKSIQSDPTWESDANFASALSWFVKGQSDWARWKVDNQ